MPEVAEFVAWLGEASGNAAIAGTVARGKLLSRHSSRKRTGASLVRVRLRTTTDGGSMAASETAIIARGATVLASERQRGVVSAEDRSSSKENKRDPRNG